MKNFSRIAIAGLAAVAGVGTAQIVDASDEHHQGDPADWGPPLEQICDDQDFAAAAAAGYNVIVLNNLPNSVVGTAADDAIFALGGDDQIDGWLGNDLICLGDGDDRGRGHYGNDAVFGEGDDDSIQGNPNRDYLDGGPGFDNCSGGPGFDVQNACEVWVP